MILANPRYTGRQVWNKQRKDGVLIDVEDVALGHTTKMRGNEPGNWIWSGRSVHVPLINAEIFERAQAVRRARGTADERSPRRTPRPYALRGIVTRQRCTCAKSNCSRTLMTGCPASSARTRYRRPYGNSKPPKPDEAAQREIAECDAQAAPAPGRPRSGRRSGPRHELDQRDAGQARRR